MKVKIFTQRDPDGFELGRSESRMHSLYFCALLTLLSLGSCSFYRARPWCPLSQTRGPLPNHSKQLLALQILPLLLKTLGCSRYNPNPYRKLRCLVDLAFSCPFLSHFLNSKLFSFM